jgi:transketolase
VRTAFIQQLIQEARSNPKVFLLTGDLGFSVLEPFAQEFPDRFINVGVAEQNMTGIAAGLAMDGWIVFTYSIANFPTLRCAEQIRYDVCYHNLNVKVVSVGAGYAYASLGASHHATEDIGMMRAIPNLVVASPGDPHEARRITNAMIQHDGPCYLRLGKAGEPSVHTVLNEFSLGTGIEVKKGKDVAILTTGAMLKYASDFIEKNNSEFGLYSFPYIKPIDKYLLAQIASSYQRITTLEEHQLSTGFGSAVLEAYSDLVQAGQMRNIPSIKRIGIADKFLHVAGSQEHLRSLADLNLAQ